MAQLTAGEKQLGTIFSKDYIFLIPSYQRPYSWEKEQTIELFSDLYDFYINNKDKQNKDNYFLGSIVLIKRDDEPTAQVVDGQQRLTTLTILFSAIMRKITNTKAKNSLKECIFEEGNFMMDVPDTPRLKLRQQDEKFFFDYIQNGDGENINKLVLPNISEPQRHIIENYKTIQELIKQKFEKDENEMQNFCKIILKQCYMVVVCTINQDSAFRIFTVMNSRGLELMPIDILKSQIIGKIEDDEKQKYTDLWEDNEEMLGRDKFNMLFSHIRMLFKKAKAKDSMLKEVSDDILNLYEGNYTGFIENILVKYASIYSNIICMSIKVNGDDFSKSINSYLLWLSRIDNSDWVPVVMQLIMKFESDGEYLNWLIKKMETLTSYLYLTGKDVNVRIERFVKILNEIDNIHEESNIKNPLKTIELSRNEINEFINILQSNVYNELNSKRRNYLILRLDSFMADKAAQYESKVLTIEHVLPQSPKEESEWNKLWEKEEQEKWLNKLANLVPLTRRHNSAAQNYDFKEKKLKYFKDPKLGVSTYAMTTQVLTYDKWTPEVVKDLQDKYINILKEKWMLYLNADIADVDELVEDNSNVKEIQITENDVRARILRNRNFIKNNIPDDLYEVNAVVNGVYNVKLTINNRREYFAGVTNIYRTIGLLKGDDYHSTARCKLEWKNQILNINIYDIVKIKK